jgi:hypothetical protein
MSHLKYIAFHFLYIFCGTFIATTGGNDDKKCNNELSERENGT